MKNKRTKCQIFTNLNNKKCTYHEKGIELYNKGEFEEAKKFFQKSIDSNPSNIESFYSKAVCQTDLKELENSISTLNIVLKKDPKHWRALLAIGINYMDISNFDMAIIYFKKVLELNKRCHEANFNLGRILYDHNEEYEEHEEYDQYERKKNLNDALKYFNTSLSMEEDSITYRYKGFVLLKLNRKIEALNCFFKAVEFENDDNNYFTIGIKLTKLNLYEEAYFFFDNSYEVSNDPNKVDIILNKGLCLYNLSKFDQAIELLKKYSSIIKTSHECFYNLGLCYYSLKNYEESIINLDIAISLEPRDNRFYLNKALCLYNLDENERAIEFFNLSIGLNKKCFESYQYKGLTLTELKKYDEALECFEKAIENNKNDYLNYFNKAQLLKEMGFLHEALNCYQIAYNLIEIDKVDKSNLKVIIESISSIENKFKKNSIQIDNNLAMEFNFKCHVLLKENILDVPNHSKFLDIESYYKEITKRFSYLSKNNVTKLCEYFSAFISTFYNIYQFSKIIDKIEEIKDQNLIMCSVGILLNTLEDNIMIYQKTKFSYIFQTLPFTKIIDKIKSLAPNNLIVFYSIGSFLLNSLEENFVNILNLNKYLVEQNFDELNLRIKSIYGNLGINCDPFFLNNIFTSHYQKYGYLEVKELLELYFLDHYTFW